MAVTAEDIAFITDHFAGVGEITVRKMMGGASIYADGTIFAMIGPGEQLFIKATGPLAEELAAAGSAQFLYTRKDGKEASMPYWTLPESALDDPEEAVSWAQKSLDASR
jgi:DNA transformation protein and related proteins